jgi:catechol 2,3-dioxygenase-like lactoylglutathione lyase family enzyme
MSGLSLATLVVGDYDEAIKFYVEAVGFGLVEDTPVDDGKRWVVVRPPGDNETSLLLAGAADDQQRSRVGNQTGGRVSFFLETDDFVAAHTRMLAAGVTFVEPPRHESYGSVAVWEDLYGNQWDLIQRRP